MRSFRRISCYSLTSDVARVGGGCQAICSLKHAVCAPEDKHSNAAGDGIRILGIRCRRSHGMNLGSPDREERTLALNQGHTDARSRHIAQSPSKPRRENRTLEGPPPSPGPFFAFLIGVLIGTSDGRAAPNFLLLLGVSASLRRPGYWVEDATGFTQRL